MRFRFPLSLPNRAEGTLLPALLGAVLAATLIAQLMWAARAPELPAALPLPAPFARAQVPVIAPASASAEIFRRPIFAPRQSASLASAGAPPPMLGGAVVAGTVSVRGRTFAVVRRPNGTSFNMAVGSRLNGWSLVGLRAEGAIFVKGNAKQLMAYGAQPVTEAEEPVTE